MKRILPLTGTEPEEEDAMDDPTREIAREKKRKGGETEGAGRGGDGAAGKIFTGDGPSRMGAAWHPSHAGTIAPVALPTGDQSNFFFWCTRCTIFC